MPYDHHGHTYVQNLSEFYNRDLDYSQPFGGRPCLLSRQLHLLFHLHRQPFHLCPRCQQLNQFLLISLYIFPQYQGYLKFQSTFSEFKFPEIHPPHSNEYTIEASPSFHGQAHDVPKHFDVSYIEVQSQVYLVLTFLQTPSFFRLLASYHYHDHSWPSWAGLTSPKRTKQSSSSPKVYWNYCPYLFNLKMKFVFKNIYCDL